MSGKTPKTPLFGLFWEKCGFPVLEKNFYVFKSGEKGVTGFAKSDLFSSILGFLGYPGFQHAYLTRFNTCIIISRGQLSLITVLILCPVLDQKGAKNRSFLGSVNTLFLDT